MVKRSLLALGLSLILIFDILGFPVSASEEQKVDLNFKVNNTVDLNSEENKKNSTINTSDYTIHITDKVEFTNDEIGDSHRYISKPVKIAITNATENTKVKISTTNNFKLTRKDGAYIQYLMYKKEFDENNRDNNILSIGSEVEIVDYYKFEIKDLWDFIRWLFSLFGFGKIPPNIKCGECYVVLDKNTINSGGEYKGTLTFEFQVK